MKLYFITGSSGKFKEAQSIIDGIEQIELDLPEIQEIDARKIIEEKLREAIKSSQNKSFFCEDTSLYIECLGGLPGPLIKWFIQTIGDKGIAELVLNYENKKAQAKTIIGYSDEKGNIEFFEGVVDGEIVSPRGDGGFGWDKIFLPIGENKTFGEMTLDEKNKFSMRKKALIKLKDYRESEKDGE